MSHSVPMDILKGRLCQLGKEGETHLHFFCCSGNLYLVWTPQSLLISLFPIVPGGFPDGSVVKNLPVRRCRFNPWVRKIPWRGKWHQLQYSCLENPMDRGAWWARVHGVAKSWTRLSTAHTTWQGYKELHFKNHWYVLDWPKCSFWFFLFW